MTMGSRVTSHFSMRGIRTLGNMMRASWSLVLDSANLDTDTSLQLLLLAAASNDSVLLLEWNRASGMERARLGS